MEWRCFSLEPSDTWVTNIYPKIQNIFYEKSETKLTCDLRKSVYVVRFQDTFVMQYCEKYSPVVYIGSGAFNQRIIEHVKKWMKNLSIDTNGINFEIFLCFPKWVGCQKEHRYVEAKLLQYFNERFGCLPFCNRRLEYFEYPHQLEEKYIWFPLTVHKGTRKYFWKISPLKSTEEKYLYR